MAEKKGTIVLGVIGSDIHVVGNKILAYALEQEGFEVVNLGIFVSIEEFIDAAIETNADAIFISSLYGHAELDCQGFREQCREAGLGDILLYVGGNLVVGKQDWDKVEKIFLDLGFDRIGSPETRPEQVVKWLKEDLQVS